MAARSRIGKNRVRNDDGPVKNGLSVQVQQRPGAVAAVPRGPSPQPAASKLTAQQQAALEKATRDGNIVRDLAFPAAMASAMPISKEVSASGVKLFLDGIVRDSGATTDVVERMLVEQLALAHQRVAQLHVRAEQAKSPEAAKVYLTAAIRLTGELRRLALALRLYRDPTPKRSFTVIKQQNLAAGRQQVAYVAQADLQRQIPFNEDGEVSSKRLSYTPAGNFVPESPESCGRPAEPALARSADTRRTRAAAAVGDQEPAVDVLDGAENSAGQGSRRRQRPMEAAR